MFEEFSTAKAGSVTRYHPLFTKQVQFLSFPVMYEV